MGIATSAPKACEPGEPKDSTCTSTPAASMCARRSAPRSEFCSTMSWPSCSPRLFREKLRNSLAPTFSRYSGVMKCSSMAMTFIALSLIVLGTFRNGKIEHLGWEPGGQLRDRSHGNEGDELQDQVGKRASPHLRDRNLAPGGAVHQEQRVAEGRRQERGLQVDG